MATTSEFSVIRNIKLPYDYNARLTFARNILSSAGTGVDDTLLLDPPPAISSAL